jgi:hypothetical protein
VTATGYHRELEWNDPPGSEERRYAGWAVIRAAGAAASRWRPLARIGDVDLRLAPPGSEGDAAALYVEPVLARKRGRRGGGDSVGVDGQVRLPVAWHDGDGPAAAEALPEWTAPLPSPSPLFAPRPSVGRAAARVAIVDVSFDNLEAVCGLGGADAAVDGPVTVGLVGLPAETACSAARASLAGLSRAPGHGAIMAGVVLAEAPGVHLGLFAIPGAAGAARPYLAATDLAAAIAAAVDGWHADVVLVAMSDGAWGTPRHLRDVLRAAARGGRGGRGAAIFCSVGDPSRNHVRKEDSASLGADDLASQPWVTAVAACDRLGRWYRVYPGYGAGNGATYNRLGPAVALSAIGEPRRYGGRIAADDSSQATALAAAAAARLLQANRDLSAVELRALLALTARVPPVVDGGRGLAAGLLDGRDRLGHSLKLGYGVVDARAGCLAARDPICLGLAAARVVPEPEPPPGVPARGLALVLAEAWHEAVEREAARAGGELARAYLGLGGRLARLQLQSLPVQEAVVWLARHLRALAETALAEGGPMVSWGSSANDHGALVERIRHAAETVRDALPPSDLEAAAFMDRLEAALAGAGAGAAVAGFVAGVLGASLARASAPVMTRAQSMSLLSDDDRQGGQS